MDCVFCSTPGGEVVHTDEDGRVVWPRDVDHPGLLRVVANAHVREWTDLEPRVRDRMFAVVCAAERTLRRLLAPTKMNLASLGNVVPHVHWHVIPRFEDDPHFPQPIWGPRQRENRRVALPATFVDDVRVTLAKELDR